MSWPDQEDSTYWRSLSVFFFFYSGDLTSKLVDCFLHSLSDLLLITNVNHTSQSFPTGCLHWNTQRKHHVSIASRMVKEWVRLTHVQAAHPLVRQYRWFLVVLGGARQSWRRWWRWLHPWQLSERWLCRSLDSLQWWRVCSQLTSWERQRKKELAFWQWALKLPLPGCFPVLPVFCARPTTSLIFSLNSF